MIYVLTYNIPHKKTQDVLCKLLAYGYREVHVIATPFVQRKRFTPLIPHRPWIPLDIDPKLFCQRLGYEYREVSSDDLLDWVQQEQPEHMLLCGAGLLPPALVKGTKIINSHPAYLPYVRGLDALKWAIYTSAPIGVTTHIISEEIDAGQLIRRELVPLYSWDTFHSVAYRQYDLETTMLVQALEDIHTAPLSELPVEGIAYRRMPHEKENELLQQFSKRLEQECDT